jgi:ADP-ribosylglycohydrolase
MNSISLQDRKRGAIWGQFVGDAASLGAHWIYDLKELQKRYPDIRGFERPYPKHYHAGKEPGDLTHYGEAALELLRSVAECRGFSEIDFGTRFIEKFASPQYKGYLDAETRETIDNYRAFQEENPDELFNYQEGANNDQMGTASRLAPVLVAHADDPKLPKIVEAATRVTQNNGPAIAFMQIHAKIVLALFKDVDLLTAIQNEAEEHPHDTPIESHVRMKIGKALSLLHFPVAEATFQLGQSCPLESSFPSAIHAALKHRDSYPKAILATIQAGGDSAGRGGLIGTWLGASLGSASIPEEWKRKLKHHKEIEQHIETIVHFS